MAVSYSLAEIKFKHQAPGNVKSLSAAGARPRVALQDAPGKNLVLPKAEKHFSSTESFSASLQNRVTVLLHHHIETTF